MKTVFKVMIVGITITSFFPSITSISRDSLFIAVVLCIGFYGVVETIEDNKS